MMRLMKMIALLLTAISVALTGKGGMNGTSLSGGTDQMPLVRQVKERTDDDRTENKKEAEADKAERERETAVIQINGDEEVTEPETAHAEEETTGKRPESSAAEKVQEETQPGKRSAAEPSIAYPVTEPEQEKETVHVHDWKERTEGIWHDAETEEVWITDSDAWDETVTTAVPVYETVKICVASCRGCGQTFSGEDYSQVIDDCHSHIISAHGNACGYGLEKSHTEQRQTGSEMVTETIHHDATGHYETVVIKEGYEEIAAAGYYCSGCGSIR